MDEGVLVRFYRALVATDISSFAVLFGLIVIVIIFQLANHNFLTPLNFNQPDCTNIFDRYSFGGGDFNLIDW